MNFLCSNIFSHTYPQPSHSFSGFSPNNPELQNQVFAAPHPPRPRKCTQTLENRRFPGFLPAKIAVVNSGLYHVIPAPSQWCWGHVKLKWSIPVILRILLTLEVKVTLSLPWIRWTDRSVSTLLTSDTGIQCWVWHLPPVYSTTNHQIPWKAASSFLMYPMMWLVWYHFYSYIFPFIIYIYLYTIY